MCVSVQTSQSLPRRCPKASARVQGASTDGTCFMGLWHVLSLDSGSVGKPNCVPRWKLLTIEVERRILWKRAYGQVHRRDARMIHFPENLFGQMESGDDVRRKAQTEVRSDGANEVVAFLDKKITASQVKHTFPENQTIQFRYNVLRGPEVPTRCGGKKNKHAAL